MKKSVTEEVIDKYSKKIFGFSLSKTKNVFDAEDLSQEILMNLSDSLNKNQEINNLEGFIYKLCFYTWSNFVRKNIKYWRVEKRDPASFEDNHQNNYSAKNAELINEIRKKIAYMSGINQQIITMHYYDNMKLVDIAKKLNINENTVRTNLRRTQLKIKEKIIMSGNLHYRPISLNFIHNGQIGSYGNLTNLLGQNILYACYKSPKTIEEISEEVQVASCYLEDYLNQYLFHDWMTLNNKKYRTNFFIFDHNFNVAMTKCAVANIKEIAVPIYDVCINNFENFKAIINEGDFSNEALMWFFTSCFSQYLWGKFYEKQIEENINTDFMIRKDGYKYALLGQLGENVEIKDAEFAKYYNNINNMNTNKLYGKIFRGLTISEVNRYSGLESVIYGYNASIYDAYKLNLVYENIKNGFIPSEKEKTILAKYIKEEVIKVVDGKPKWNVIFMEKAAANKFYDLLLKMTKQVEKEILIKYLENNKKIAKQYISKHLAKEMFEYYSLPISVFGPVMVYLEENNYLKMPKRKECKLASEWFYIHD